MREDKHRVVPRLALIVFTLITCTQIHANSDDNAGGASASPGAVAGSSDARAGRALFLKNCADCHGVDASGDEGPDLHNLDLTAEEIEHRIKTGKKGQMTAFAGKLQQPEIDALVKYVRGLKYRQRFTESVSGGQGEIAE